MFRKKSADNTRENKIISEGNLLDGLCALAVERHFNDYFSTASKHHFSQESTDQITFNICEALVKDMENEIWKRIAPLMTDRVTKMKEIAIEATGEHKIVKN